MSLYHNARECSNSHLKLLVLASALMPSTSQNTSSLNTFAKFPAHPSPRSVSQSFCPRPVVSRNYVKTICAHEKPSEKKGGKREEGESKNLTRSCHNLENSNFHFFHPSHSLTRTNAFSLFAPLVCVFVCILCPSDASIPSHIMNTGEPLCEPVDLLHGFCMEDDATLSRPEDSRAPVMSDRFIMDLLALPTGIASAMPIGPTITPTSLPLGATSSSFSLVLPTSTSTSTLEPSSPTTLMTCAEAAQGARTACEDGDVGVEEGSDISTDVGDTALWWDTALLDGRMGSGSDETVGGENNADRGDGVDNAKDVNGQERKGKIEKKTNGVEKGGSENRRRRRREFHKIHTRRSRAKLNEKMEMLRRVLPDPPAGVVVKSKAQIIDYAITVLGELSMGQLAVQCTANSPGMHGE